MTITVTLPWPDRRLNPNVSRGLHWAQNGKARKQAKSMTLGLLRAAGVLSLPCDALTVAVRFDPPDNRRRDTDNLIASMKPALDAIAEATGVDDSAFTLTFTRGDVCKGGRVVVSLEAEE